MPGLALELVQGLPGGSTLRKKERDWGRGTAAALSTSQCDPAVSTTSIVTGFAHSVPPGSARELEQPNREARCVAKKWLGRSNGFPSTPHPPGSCREPSIWIIRSSYPRILSSTSPPLAFFHIDRHSLISRSSLSLVLISCISRLLPEFLLIVVEQLHCCSTTGTSFPVFLLAYCLIQLYHLSVTPNILLLLPAKPIVNDHEDSNLCVSVSLS